KDSEGPDPNDLFSRIHPDDQDFIKEVYKKLEIGDFKRDIEFRMIMEDSSIRCLRSTLYLEEDDFGSPMLSGYIEDISSLKSNEIKLKDLSNKKNAILNILSHDLAGPLGSIRHYTYVLNKKTKSLGDPLIPQIIASIEKISTRSIDMIQEFLKVEFMESAGVDLIKRRENLIEKLKPFVEEYQKSDKKLGKTFHFTCPDHPIYVDIDENK